MKYFCSNDERFGSCYHEYQRGHLEKRQYWRDSSLYLDDDIAVDIKLHEIYFEVIKDYDPYSADRYFVNKVMWDEVLRKAIARGGAVKEAVMELSPWAEENFKTEKEFTIITI